MGLTSKKTKKLINLPQADVDATVDADVDASVGNENIAINIAFEGEKF